RDPLDERLRHQVPEALLVAQSLPSDGRFSSLLTSGMRSKPGDALDKIADALTGRAYSFHNRRTPLLCAERLKGQVCFDGRHESVAAISIRLIDDEDVGDLHDAGFERLHFIAAPRHQHDD